MVKDALIFLAHWHHAIGFIIGMGYVFKSGYDKLGKTEELVRTAMTLSPENPEREGAIAAIDRAQRAAIRQMRISLFFSAGILYLMFR